MKPLDTSGPDDDDLLCGCDLDFAADATVSSPEDVVAILCFGDLSWVGEARGRPVCDQSHVAKRVVQLRILAEAAR